MDVQVAQNAVTAAIAKGKLVRPPICSKCGKRALVDAHHPDYSKPLEIIWLCHSCHLKLHGLLTKLNRPPENKQFIQMRQDIIDTVRQRQIQEGLSNRQLALKLGISDQMWNFLVKGQREASFKVWAAIRKVYPDLTQPILACIHVKMLSRVKRNTEDMK